MKKQYFRVGPVLVSQAAAMSGGVLVGMPAMYAYTGWLKNLTLKLGRVNGCQVRPLAIAPVFHEFTVHRGHAKYVRYRKGQIAKVEKDGPNHPTIDEPKCSFELTLVIAIECDTIDFQADRLAPLLRGMKLAGGGISSALHTRVDINVKKIEQSDLYYGLPFNSIALADAGFVIDDARASGVNGFDAMFQALVAPRRDKVVAPDKFQRPLWLSTDDTIGQYFPVCAGAMPIEQFQNPQQRSGIRQADSATTDKPTLHAFAESVFTLVRGQTIASVRATKRQQLDREPAIFWREVPPKQNEAPFFGAQSIQGHQI
jgi:CRISPR-associated protein (Cas_Csy2)